MQKPQGNLVPGYPRSIGRVSLLDNLLFNGDSEYFLWLFLIIGEKTIELCAPDGCQNLSALEMIIGLRQLLTDQYGKD
jgi:hypothetical protein